MDELGRPITDLFGIDLVYGYLFVGVIIGFVVGRVTAPKPAPPQVSGGSPRRASAVVKHRAATEAGAVEGNTAIAPEVAEQISALVARGEKAAAVKQLREVTGFDLAEAQQAIDRLERQLNR